MVTPRVLLLLLLLCCFSFSLSRDSPCPRPQSCVPATSCDWYNRFQALPRGPEKKKLRAATARAICNRAEKKICCPLPEDACPAWTKCMSYKECPVHREKVESLKKLGRGTPEYAKRKQELRNSTFYCGEKRDKTICCAQTSADDHEECGYRPLGDGVRIAGGAPVYPGEFPWMAMLKYGKKQEYADPPTVLCGGALISTRHVLTAAHCTFKGNPTTVVLGENDLRTEYDCLEVEKDCDTVEGCPCEDYRDANTGLTSKVCQEDEECADRQVEVAVHKVIIHPEQRVEYDIVHYDAAILVLQAAITPFSKYIFPICLNTEVTPPGTIVTLTGWGNTEAGLKAAKSAIVLQKLLENITTEASCSDKWQLADLGGLQPYQICADTFRRGHAGCPGDSGGPLVQIDTYSEQYSQVGIVSQGASICGQAQPTMYTKVSEIEPWITKIMKDY